MSSHYSGMILSMFNSRQRIQVWSVFIVLGAFVLSQSVFAEPVQAKPKLAPTTEAWTEIGMYGFMSDITGDVQVRNVTADVDVPFKDLLENLDLGLMGFVEHRRGKLSLIGDIYYANISVEDTIASNAILTITADAEVKQLLAEAFVGYRVYEQDVTGTKLGIDILGGLRYNTLEVDLGVQVSVLGLSAAISRNRTEDWGDGVIGVRAQYGGRHGHSPISFRKY